MSDSVIVKMVGAKLVVEVDILKAIAEGMGDGRPVGTVAPRPWPKDTSATAS